MGTSISTRGLDSYVRRDYPHSTFATGNLVRVNNAAATTTLAYLWRVPPDLPRGTTVVSAHLRLVQQYDQPAGVPRTLVLHRVAEKFDVRTVTWETIPPVVASPSVSVTKVGTQRRTEWVLDVTEHLQAAVDGLDWWGWRLSTPEAAELAFFSYDAPAELRPQLTIVWSDQPRTPDGLTPGTGQVVAVPKPVLSSQFLDLAGDVRLTAVQVQINGADTWAEPAWDSGVVETTVPELDLKDTSYPGIPAGGSVWWRIRHRDGSGQWSEWSDAVRPKHVAPGTLVVTSPSGIVEDESPTVAWTFNRPQTAWQVLVYRLPDIVPIWSLARRAGSAKATQVPAAALPRDDRPYRVEVRVWDDEPRVATPGVPAYRSATSDFTLDVDGSQTAPTNLVAARADADQVAVRLTWSRAIAPDGWLVTRFGDRVMTRLDADGTTGEFVDYGAAPRTAHTYAVQAVVNGKVGPPAYVETPADLLTTTGVWLVDPIDGQRVVIFQDGIGDWSLGEDTVVHEPLGAPSAVPVTRTLGAARGTVTGELVDTHDIARSATRRTYQEWVDAWLDLRGRTGAVLRLVAADRNIPVVVWGMTERPVAYGANVRSAVQASWAQAGEYAGGPR